MRTPRKIINEIEDYFNKSFEEINGIFYDIAGMDYTGNEYYFSDGFSLAEFDAPSFYMLKKDGKAFRTVRVFKDEERIKKRKEKAHRERFTKLLARVDTDIDNERKALFWLLSSHTDLYNKAKEIYDFESNMIRIDCFDKVGLSGSQQTMLKLGFSLYNNYDVNISDCFNLLDEYNFEVAIESIRIRYNKK